MTPHPAPRSPEPVLLAAARAVDAISDGLRARIAGYSRARCPYPEGHPLHADWHAGWTEADRYLRGGGRP